MPSNVDKNIAQCQTYFEEFSRFSDLIANCCVEIEKSFYLLDSLDLYKLFTFNEKKNSIIEKLKSFYNKEQDDNILNFAQKGIWNTFYENTKSFIKGTLGFGALTKNVFNYQTMVNFVRGSQTFQLLQFVNPLNILINITGNFILNYGFTLFQDNQTVQEIQKNKIYFEELYVFLVDYNFELKNKLKYCFESQNQLDFDNRVIELNKFTNQILNNQSFNVLLLSNQYNNESDPLDDLEYEYEGDILIVKQKK